MQYFKDFTSKTGFDNGTSVPSNIALYQEAYIYAINALCHRFGSKFKAIHYSPYYEEKGPNTKENWVRIIFLPKTEIKQFRGKLGEDFHPINPEDEDILERVIDALMKKQETNDKNETSVDEAIVTEPHIDFDDLDEIIDASEATI